MTRLPASHERQAPVVSKRKRAAFLEALAGGYSVTHAAKAAGAHRASFYRLRDRDEEFAEAWLHAFESGTDVLRDELRRRAVEGWDEPMVSAGKVVANRRMYSDRLLELELKRRDPSYRERSDVNVATVVGYGGKPLNTQHGVSLEEIAKVMVECGVDLAALAAGDPILEGELIAEYDEPAALPPSIEDGAA